MSNQGTIANLIRSVSQNDPQLYAALQLMVSDIYKMYGELFPTVPLPDITNFSKGIPADVTGFTLEPFPTNLRANWDTAVNAIGYEIRKGSNWDTADFVLTTAQSAANLDPIVLDLIVGSHEFLIKGLNFSGEYSVNAASATLVVPIIPSPSLTGTPLANNALLSWSVPVSTWRIRFYNVFQDGVQIAQIDSNFLIASVLIGGTYNFQVQAEDIVGNLSDLSPVLPLVLDDPIDFVFIKDLFATLNGTYVRTKRTIYNGLDGILGPINDTETWQSHFTSRGWNSPQDQINAGFPYYIQPTTADGYYQEQFDFLIVYNNVTIVTGFSKFNIVGNTIFTTEISYSADNITYTPFAPGPAILATSVRYVRVKWVFTNANNLDFGFITALKVSISTQLVLDSGSSTTTLAINGTVVTTNKKFLAVNSVTLTSDTVFPVTLVFDAVTPGNPTTFKVFAFDSAGNRVAVPFSWKVRGVI